MMDITALIATHGYWVLALGCLLEGETVLLLAGFAAHGGYLEIDKVLFIAAACGFAGDEFFFWLGRRHGAALLKRAPRIAAQAQRVQRLVARHHGWLIIGTRFAYGLRTAGPVLMGSCGLSPWRFASFNALGAVLWAAVVAGLGWSFGQALEMVLGRVGHLELAIVAGALTAAAATALIRRWWRGMWP